MPHLPTVLPHPYLACQSLTSKKLHLKASTAHRASQTVRAARARDVLHKRAFDELFELPGPPSSPMKSQRKSTVRSKVLLLLAHSKLSSVTVFTSLLCHFHISEEGQWKDIVRVLMTTRIEESTGCCLLFFNRQLLSVVFSCASTGPDDNLTLQPFHLMMKQCN